MTYYEALLKTYLESVQAISVVQIGANDGRIGDPIYSFVMENKTATRVLLIEPQPEIIPFLEDNYKTHERVTIFNGAIGSGEVLELFRVRPELWDSYNPPYMKDAPPYRVPSGFTSSSLEHVMRHASGNFTFEGRLEDCIEKISVPCMNLEKLITSLSWETAFDVLQIDAEGTDDDVIYSSDVPTLRPGIINYERMHLNKAKQERLEAFLVAEGYELVHWNPSDTAAILVN